MKAMRVVVAACAVLAMSSVAHADLILVGGTATNSFVDLTGQGFGNNPRLLTLQTNVIETGGATPNLADLSNPVLIGDAVKNAGGNKTNTPTLSSLGWTSGSQVGIGFNSNQIGGAGITLQSLT